MQAEAIALDKLLLDPNNYRLQEQEGFVEYPEERFHLERVQVATLKRLKGENLEPLRNSIVSNGFLEIERIVVVPYPHEEGKYLVIEGNRRVAALSQIRDEYNAGILIPNNVVRVFDAVPCIVAQSDHEESYFREAIMGIRHVGGIREWGGYQRAKLVADLRDKHDLDSSSISDRIGLSVIEVNRRYRAFKALQQMQNDENFTDFAKASLYPLFHEAVSLPAVREWLGWNSDTNTFDNQEKLELFYGLITPRQLESGDKPPKLKSYADVRTLKDILGNTEAKAELLEMDRELVDALTLANRSRISTRWKTEVSEATVALQNIPALELASLELDDLKIILDLINVAERIVEIHRRTG